MLLHRHCVDVSETAISINSAKFVFPKADNVGQSRVAHSAILFSSHDTRSWSKTLYQNTRQPHQHSVTAACKGTSRSPDRMGDFSTHTAFSCEPRVTSAGTQTAAHGAFFTWRNEMSPARDPSLQWLPTHPGLRYGQPFVQTHTQLPTLQRDARTLKRLPDKLLAHHTKTVQQKSSNYACVGKKG